jgi:hypothetical protein
MPKSQSFVQPLIRIGHTFRGNGLSKNNRVEVAQRLVNHRRVDVEQFGKKSNRGQLLTLN